MSELAATLVGHVVEFFGAPRSRTAQVLLALVIAVCAVASVMLIARTF